MANGALSEKQLFEAADQLNLKLNPIHTLYDLPEKLPLGANLILISLPEIPNQGHWVGLHVTNKKVYYFDPLAFKPPDELQSYLNMPILANSTLIQPMNQNHCGSYCLLFLHDMKQKDGSLESRFKKHVSRYL